jgi:nitroreductase
MEVLDVILKRSSIRSYKPDPVPEEKLNKILEAGRLAPSAHNAQNWKFIVVKDKEKIKKIANSSLNQTFIAEAPIVIVGVSLDPEHIMASGVPAYAVDLAIAIDHMILEATELGLGTCWIGAFKNEEIKKILNIPERYKVVALFPLGYPNEKGRPKQRKPLEEIVSYDSF